MQGLHYSASTSSLRCETFSLQLTCAMVIATVGIISLNGCDSPYRLTTPAETLVVGQVSEPKSLDPHVSTATNDFRILVNIYDGLVRFKRGSLELEPALAKSWSVSEDGRTYTFTLRQNVRFHDGSPFNADAVKFNFDRMLRKDHPFHYTGPFPLAFFFNSVQKVEALDPFKVRFILDKPYAPFLSNLAYPTGLIVSPAKVTTEDEQYGRHPSGTGPFKFSEWESYRKVTLERNDDYWGEEPSLKKLVFRPLSDDNARITEMFAGGIDVLMESPPDLIPVFVEKGFHVHQTTGPHLWFLILNMKEGIFGDRRAREAINYAINKESIIENILQDTASVASGPIPEAFSWACNDKVSPYPYDPVKAKALFEQAGYQGETLTFLVPEGGSGMLSPSAMAAAMQADLAAAGVSVVIETYEWNTYLNKVNKGLEGQADMAQMAWMTNDPDTLPFLTLRTEAQPEYGGFNSGYYSNELVDELLLKARQTTDYEQRGAYYKKIHAIVHDDAPWFFMASAKATAVTNKNVSNFSLQPSFLLPLHFVKKHGGIRY